MKQRTGDTNGVTDSGELTIDDVLAEISTRLQELVAIAASRTKRNKAGADHPERTMPA